MDLAAIYICFLKTQKEIKNENYQKVCLQKYSKIVTSYYKNTNEKY
jgi:hypothetical protein